MASYWILTALCPSKVRLENNEIRRLVTIMLCLLDLFLIHSPESQTKYRVTIWSKSEIVFGKVSVWSAVEWGISFKSDSKCLLECSCVIRKGFALRNACMYVLILHVKKIQLSRIWLIKSLGEGILSFQNYWEFNTNICTVLLRTHGNS